MDFKPKIKKKRKPAANSSSARNSTVWTDSQTHLQKPAFPLVSFLWPARKSTSQWIVLPLVLMIAGLYRWVVGFWGYSGFDCPPMFGDFEAQRHWIEITSHLPISQWYFYDLQYWGLDYPPLTAYHSWVLGKIGSIINPAWFALDASRGLQEALLKVYMRATVLVSEYIIYMPAAVVFNRKFSRQQGISIWESSIALVGILMQPAIILIDHGHFQYNTVMLGLVLASMSSMIANRILWGCVFFVAALCYKQMALYYAPAVFAYLLGVSLVPSLNTRRLGAIAVITALTFLVMLSPLLIGALYDRQRGIGPAADVDHSSLPSMFSWAFDFLNPKSWYYALFLQLAQCIHRVFPFARGLFEDKVANFWCAFNTIHKLHVYPKAMAQRISLSATLILILPACMTISVFPRRDLLPWAMASSAWGFFLCSFQVHEKSVLLPLLPMTILLGSNGGLGPEIRAWVGWANTLGTWTLFPLLKKDELRVPYFVLSLLWAFLLGLPPTSLSLYLGSSQASSQGYSPLKGLTKLLHLSFYAAMLIWHLGEAFIPPPDGKPDLWVVLNVIIGAAGFGVCYLWCSWQVILRSGVLDDYFQVRRRLESGTKKTQ